MQAVVVIHNPSAGGAADQALAAAVTRLRERVEVAEAMVEHPDQISGVLDDYHDHLPVAAGGDGTVHALVAALVARGEASRRPIGLIPLGTGNDLARAVDLPHDAAEAASVVLDGTDRWMDLLVDDTDSIAVNAIHLGLGAEATQTAKPLKPLFHRFAYAVGGVLAGVRSSGWRLRVEVDGRVAADGRRPILMLGLGNGTSIGGGTPLTPDARLDDGRADVVLYFASGLAERIGYALLLRRGEHARHRQVRTLRGSRITVTLRGGRIPVSADGELGELIGGRSWRVEPRAWRIRAGG